jgi:DnaJ-domain-containing protein 1
MTEALKEVVEQIQHLAEQLGPAEQETYAQALLERLKELEEEREWDALVSSPKSQAFLEKLSAEIDEQIAAGKIHDLDEIL